MAEVTSLRGFDQRDLNFHKIVKSSWGATLAEDRDVEMLGKTYPDLYGFYWEDRWGSERVMGLLGRDFSVDSGGGLNGGTIGFIGDTESTYFGLLDKWYISDLNLSALRLARVAATRGTADDQRVLDGMFAGADRFMLSGFDDYADGRGGSDLLRGRGGDDVLLGGAGNDTLRGEAGSDILVLDSGDDLLVGGSGRDTVQAAGTRRVAIDLAETGVQATGRGHDTIRGVENALGAAGHDRIGGNRRDNLLDGGTGNDRLDGRGGDDWLIGGEGRDTMTGGAGADHFVFATVDEMGGSFRKADAITDFRAGRDVIDLGRIGADFAFSGHALDGAGAGIACVRLDRPGDDRDWTVILVDQDGDGRADGRIRLAGLHDLSADDFIL